MKKTKAFYKIIVFVLIVVSVMMFSGIAKAAAITVDGFAGVPWGTSKQHVAKEMAQRDFKQVAEGTNFGTNYVVYRGTFADLPADLTFGFGKNGFYTGEADVLSCRDQDIVFAMGLYPSIKRLLVTKYGPPDALNDAPVVTMNGEGIISFWHNLRTGGTSPGPASITLQAGPGRRFQTAAVTTTRDTFRKGILVTYSANIIRDSY